MVEHNPQQTAGQGPEGIWKAAWEDEKNLLHDGKKDADIENWALCLSGGGIRSATFCLGVLQGLAKNGLLEKFHYLSTVSGGGYIGSWLSSLIHRRGLSTAIDLLAKSSCQKPSGREPLTQEPREIRRLRSFSNYLSPVWGLSTDFFTLVATFLRNLFLNWLVLLPLIAAVLLLPRIYIGFLGLKNVGATGTWSLLAVAAALMMVGIAYIAANLPGRAMLSNPSGHRSFIGWCFLPIFLSIILFSFLGNAAGWKVPGGPYLVWIFMAVGVATHFLGGLFSLVFKSGKGPTISLGRNALDFLATVISGAFGGFLLYGITLSKFAKDFYHTSPMLYATLAVPLLLLGYWAATALYAGYMRKYSSEMDREWWSRSGAWWIRAALGWVLLFTIVIYLPRWVFLIPGLGGLSTETLVTGGGTLGVVTGLIGYWSKNGAQIKEGTKSFLAATGLRLLDIAAIVFLLFLAVVLLHVEARALDWWVERDKFSDIAQIHLSKTASLKATDATAHASKSVAEAIGAVSQALKSVKETNSPAAPQARDSLDRAMLALEKATNWINVEISSLAAQTAKISNNSPAKLAAAYAGNLQWGIGSPLLVIIACFILSVIGYGMSQLFVGVNTFSLHSMYGNRLVRAYLGATNQTPSPHWFTGFDPGDNIAMSALAANKLFHVVNVALNLVKPSGNRLEWQQRKAASFTFSPLHAGSPETGFVGAETYAGGVTLGRAMTISGAAASPNMGYHTSMPVAFVMTLLNARLGWWLPNPKKQFKDFWKHREPSLSLRPLLAEALAQSTDETPYVYLSDGGHFDNLGLYEMIRRRCCKIVVVDAECDPDFKYEGLENAIRKARIDFGVNIEFENGLPSPDNDLGVDDGRVWNKVHYALGTIAYADGGVGEICYIKSILKGGEPLDVVRYAELHSTGANPFPHQSTGDQFFDEAQFESYRKLGEHSACGIVPDPKGWLKPPNPRGGGGLKFREHTPQPLPPVPSPRGGGLLSGLSDAFGSMGQGALLASAITIGGVVGVSGTVALKDSTVSLKPGSEIGLRQEDRDLLRNGITHKFEPTLNKDELADYKAAINSLADALNKLKNEQPIKVAVSGSESGSNTNGNSDDKLSRILGYILATLNGASLNKDGYLIGGSSKSDSGASSDNNTNILDALNAIRGKVDPQYNVHGVVEGGRQ